MCTPRVLDSNPLRSISTYPYRVYVFAWFSQYDRKPFFNAQLQFGSILILIIQTKLVTYWKFATVYFTYNATQYHLVGMPLPRMLACLLTADNEWVSTSWCFLPKNRFMFWRRAIPPLRAGGCSMKENQILCRNVVFLHFIREMHTFRLVLRYSR